MEFGYYCVGLILILVVSGEALPTQTESKKPCCGPDQREGSAYSMITYSKGDFGVATAYQIYWHAAMDYRNQRFAFNMSNFQDGVVTGWGVYLNFKQSWGYIVWWDLVLCFKLTKQELDNFKFMIDRECLPKDSTFYLSPKIGMAPNDMPVDYWHYNTEEPPAKMSTIAAVQSDKCVPVVEYQEGTEGADLTFTRSNTYLLMSTGIKDQAGLNPPGFCPPHTQEDFLQFFPSRESSAGRQTKPPAGEPDRDLLLDIMKKILM